MSLDRIHVLYINDVAFIVDSLRPQLERLGVSVTMLGAQSGVPSTSRHRFVRTSAEILGSHRAFSRCDVVHVNYGLYGYFLLGTRKPAVLHLHGSDIRPNPIPRYRFANLVSLLASRFADRVWYSTTDLAPYLTRISTPHRFMPNPVSSTFFATNGDLPPTPRVLFAVPLTRLKGAQIAVRAMALLTASRPSLRVSCFTFGPDANEAKQFAALIPKSVERLAWTPRSNVAHLLSQTTVVVGRLGLGSLGVLELEAMAAGRPLIAELGSQLRLADRYYTEEPPLLPRNDAEGVCQAVIDLLEDRDKAVRLAAAGRSWVHRFHSAEVVAKIYSEEYRAIADR